MNKKISLFSGVSILALTALLTACTGSGGDSGQFNDKAGSSWHLNGVSYSNTARTTATSESSALTIVGVGTDGADQGNGHYAGSSLLIAHSLTSPGEYRIVESLASFMAALDANPADKVAHVAITVGTALQPVAATRYESAGTGTLSVTIDENGNYHFSSNKPLVVNKVADLGDGVANAPESAQLAMMDVHDIQ